MILAHERVESNLLEVSQRLHVCQNTSHFGELLFRFSMKNFCVPANFDLRHSRIRNYLSAGNAKSSSMPNVIGMHAYHRHPFNGFTDLRKLGIAIRRCRLRQPIFLSKCRNFIQNIDQSMSAIGESNSQIHLKLYSINELLIYSASMLRIHHPDGCKYGANRCTRLEPRGCLSRIYAFVRDRENQTERQEHEGANQDQERRPFFSSYFFHGAILA